MLGNRFVSRENAEAKGFGTIDMNRQTNNNKITHIRQIRGEGNGTQRSITEDNRTEHNRTEHKRTV
jgi:hypothetical protein